jgi:glutathione S-transferase
MPPNVVTNITVAGLLAQNRSTSPIAGQIPELVVRSKQRVANFYADFDARLEEVLFVAGADFSAADITALVTVDFATAALKMPIPEDRRTI